jgi:hypothetical protein
MMMPNLRIIKEDIKKIVDESKESYRKHPEAEDIGDDIDQSIISNIETINENPALATTGSCSGHDGWPYISVVFRDRRARDIYLKLIKEKVTNVHVMKSDEYRMGWFDQVSEWKITEEWNAGIRAKSKKAGKKFWAEITEVLKVRTSG